MSFEYHEPTSLAEAVEQGARFGADGCFLAGGTDARLWRQRGIPALVHGPFPRGMAQADEHVEIEEYLHIVRMHVLSAFDYLSR